MFVHDILLLKRYISPPPPPRFEPFEKKKNNKKSAYKLSYRYGNHPDREPSMIDGGMGGGMVFFGANKKKIFIYFFSNDINLLKKLGLPPPPPERFIVFRSHTPRGKRVTTVYVNKSNGWRTRTPTPFPPPRKGYKGVSVKGGGNNVVFGLEAYVQVFRT